MATEEFINIPLSVVRRKDIGSEAKMVFAVISYFFPDRRDSYESEAAIIGANLNICAQNVKKQLVNLNRIGLVGKKLNEVEIRVAKKAERDIRRATKNKQKATNRAQKRAKKIDAFTPDGKLDKPKIAANMKLNPTKTEAMVWARLKDRQLGVEFVTQPVRMGYIPDFICDSAKLLVEIDGSVHDQRKDYDAHRDGAFEKFGYKTLRFSNLKVRGDLEGVIRDIQYEVKFRLMIAARDRAIA